MSESVFCYVEFEPFADAGHRIHTANHYAAKLRVHGGFDRYRIIAPPSRLSATDLKQALSGYDSVDLSLDELLTPAVDRTNIDAVGVQLKAALHASAASADDTRFVYSHMPSPFALLALYGGVRAFADESGTRPRVLVRLCMIDEEWAWYRFKLSRLIATIQADPVVGELFQFTTESKRLSEYYLERCGFDAPMQFNPFSDDELVVTTNKHRYHRALYGNRVQFAYLGEAREEKGFQYLPKLVTALRESGVEFSFLVHAFSNKVNDTEPIRAARDTLIQMAAERPHLHLVKYPVPDSIYSAHQRRADVVVMPYLHRAYRIRGSGVAFEAIRSNAFILAAEDLDFGVTFMDSGRVVEYRPSDVDVSRIHEVVAKVHAARGAGWGGLHPAESYRSCFFEAVVDTLLERQRAGAARQAVSDAEQARERFAQLLERLSRRTEIATLTQSLNEAGFALT